MTVVIGVVWLGLTMCEMRNHYVRYWWGVQCNLSPCSADDGGDWCCVAGVVLAVVVAIDWLVSCNSGCLLVDANI